MTREEFIERLDKIKCDYRIEDDKIVITNANRTINTRLIEEIPKNVVFENMGNISFFLLSHLPEGTIFKNLDNVYLGSLKNIHPSVKFFNRGDVWISKLIENGYVNRWEGNIGDINSKRLLNLMISKEFFI